MNSRRTERLAGMMSAFWLPDGMHPNVPKKHFVVNQGNISFLCEKILDLEAEIEKLKKRR